MTNPDDFEQQNIALQLATGAEASIVELLSAALPELHTSITTLKAIAAKTNASIRPADTKQLARELVDTNRAVIRILRLLTRDLDSTRTDA